MHNGRISRHHVRSWVRSHDFWDFGWCLEPPALILKPGPVGAKGQNNSTDCRCWCWLNGITFPWAMADQNAECIPFDSVLLMGWARRKDFAYQLSIPVPPTPTLLQQYNVCCTFVFVCPDQDEVA